MVDQFNPITRDYIMYTAIDVIKIAKEGDLTLKQLNTFLSRQGYVLTTKQHLNEMENGCAFAANS